MSAEIFSRHLPDIFTLADVAAMADADQRGHRYELSPEGTLSIMPPPGVEHAVIASRMFAWFITHGWPVERVLQNVGVKVIVDGLLGGRVPDLTVWSALPLGPVWSDVKDLLLAIEIISPGSERTDRIIKKDEYAAAGVPNYWVVSQDPPNTVSMWRLEPDGYRPVQAQPLAWLLNTTPEQHLA